MEDNSNVKLGMRQSMGMPTTRIFVDDTLIGTGAVVRGIDRPTEAHYGGSSWLDDIVVGIGDAAAGKGTAYEVVEAYAEHKLNLVQTATRNCSRAGGDATIYVVGGQGLLKEIRQVKYTHITESDEQGDIVKARVLHTWTDISKINSAHKNSYNVDAKDEDSNPDDHEDI